MDQSPLSYPVGRRDLLKGAAIAAGLAAGAQLVSPAPAGAQTPKRGGTLRLALQSDPVTGFDPHQSISFLTMIPLSFAYSRLVKVKAGPSVKPMTYPLEPDLAESWTQPDDKTYVFKLKKGVRFHNKPPVNGRELTADDVKYTYERFLSIAGNGNKPVLESVDKIDVVDKHTVKFTLKEPNAWFLDMLASTSTWIIAKECVEKFGDLKKMESVVGTGPWMLETWEPNVRPELRQEPQLLRARAAVRRRGRRHHRQGPLLAAGRLARRQARLRPGVPAGGPPARPAAGQAAQARTCRRPSTRGSPAALSGSRSTSRPSTMSRCGGRSRAPSTWRRSTSPTRSPRATGRRTRRFPPPPPSGRSPSTSSVPRAGSSTSTRRPRPRSSSPRPVIRTDFKTQVDVPSTGYGPDFLDSAQITVKNWKSAGIDAEMKMKEYGAFISSTIYGKFDQLYLGLARRLGGPRGVLLPPVHAGPAPERPERERSRSWWR